MGGTESQREKRKIRGEYVLRRIIFIVIIVEGKGKIFCFYCLQAAPPRASGKPNLETM